jgi:hypothetical protein
VAGWTKLRRETGLLEHICEHGIGHPNWGSALWCAEAYGEADNSESLTLKDVHGAWMTHGCDGCCRDDEDFPGGPFESLIHAHEIIKTLNDQVRDLSDD